MCHTYKQITAINREIYYPPTYLCVHLYSHLLTSLHIYQESHKGTEEKHFSLQGVRLGFPTLVRRKLSPPRQEEIIFQKEQHLRSYLGTDIVLEANHIQFGGDYSQSK